MAITTIYTYPLTGSQREFTVPFEYLARRFVVLTLIGQDRKELVLATDFRFISKTIVQTTVPWGPADGYERIEIRRDTSATDRLVDFADGSILRASELNISQIQTLHVAEEARNMVADTISENADGDLDARGRRLANLADATDPGHAVTLRQEQAWSAGALNQANRAEAEARAAAASAAAALGSKNAAATSETNAAASAAAALGSKNAAATSETNAAASAAAALGSKNAAAASETNAAASAAAALGSKNAAAASETNAAAWAAGVNMPSATGSGGKILAQRADESGFEYVKSHTAFGIGGVNDWRFYSPFGPNVPPSEFFLKGTVVGFADGGNSDPIKSLVIPQLGAGTSYGVLTVSGQYSDVSGLHAIQREFVSGTLRKFLSVAASSDTWSVWIEVGGGIPGQVAAFAMMTPPPGWLQCNGAAVSRVSFAHLFSAIGTAYGSGDGTTTFNVPDLRGEFVRGWDAGRGVDAGRTLGSKQGARTGSAGLEDFTEIRSAYASGTVEFNVFAPKPGHPNYGGTTAYRSGLTPSAIGETRPRNVALMYCIKT